MALTQADLAKRYLSDLVSNREVDEILAFVQMTPTERKAKLQEYFAPLLKAYQDRSKSLATQKTTVDSDVADISTFLQG